MIPPAALAVIRAACERDARFPVSPEALAELIARDLDEAGYEIHPAPDTTETDTP